MKNELDRPGRVDLTACTHFGRQALRTYYSCTFQPVSWDEDITSRTDLFLFDGVIYLRYSKAALPPFRLIAFDKWLYKNNFVGFWNWEDFLKKCKKNERFEWIRRTTDISPEILQIAADNYGAHVPVCVNIIKYYNECGGTTRVTTKGVMEEVIRQRQIYKKAKQDALDPVPLIKNKEQTDEH